MTERILSPQLLKLVQAAGPGYSLADPEWVKKFAELILRECCQFEKTYGGDAGLVARSFSRKIREHFGVEE